MQKIPLTLWRVPAWTEYLEECRSGAAWESLGISEIAQQIRYVPVRIRDWRSGGPVGRIIGTAVCLYLWTVS